MDKREEGGEIDQNKRQEQPRRSAGSLKRQAIGSVIGAVIGLVVALVLRPLGWLGGDTLQYVLWGAVIGGLFGDSDGLAQAGQRLTRREDTWLNILVSLLGMVVILGVLFGLSYALTSLFRGPLNNWFGG